jgi:hypothetical protein
MKRVRPFSVYPDESLRSKLRIIGDESDRAASRVALRFIRAGVRRWEKRRQKQPA